MPCALRRPADRAFLERRLAAIDWFDKPPTPGSRRHLVETCRAELEWSRADWRRLGGIDDRTDGPHPSEAWRLPHETAAARLVNAHLHLDVETWRIDALLRHLPDQRRAAIDPTQSEKYRLDWADVATGGLRDLQVHRTRRCLAWRVFLSAAAEYRLRRATIDRQQALNSGVESGQTVLQRVA
ncbi:MAG: hypothetical protein ACHQK9_14385 [Reyranellales bacterium]